MRLMDALRRLPAPVTAARLAAETEISRRQHYRDIATLRAGGALIDAAGLGYTLTEVPVLPPQSFTRIEIEALIRVGWSYCVPTPPPVPPARGIRSRHDFDLGSEITIGHKAERITGLGIPSDALRRRGTACQFDWSHEIVLIDGVTTTVKVAQVRLCHSRMLSSGSIPARRRRWSSTRMRTRSG